MNADKLINALENENNESIINLSTMKIMQMNLDILKELHLPRQTTLDYLKKLKGYRYIDEMHELKHGAFIRWIPITEPDYLPLNRCGIICEINITDNGTQIVCKNFMHRHFTFKMDECLIFQKLTNQEQIIINVLDHLEKEQDNSCGTDSEEDDIKKNN